MKTRSFGLSEARSDGLFNIGRARDLCFSMRETGALVGLWQNRRRASSDVKKLAARRTRQLDEKTRELQAMRDSPAHLAEHCHGDDRPDCPILEDLAAEHDAQRHHGKRPAVRGARAHGGEPSAPTSARGGTSASRTRRFY